MIPKHQSEALGILLTCLIWMGFGFAAVGFLTEGIGLGIGWVATCLQMWRRGKTKMAQLALVCGCSVLAMYINYVYWILGWVAYFPLGTVFIVSLSGFLVGLIFGDTYLAVADDEEYERRYQV